MASNKSDKIKNRESPDGRLPEDPCPTSKKTTVKNSSPRQRNHSYSKEFRCRYCKKGYSYAARVERHESICPQIHKTAKSLCIVCGVSFASPNSATNHVLFQHTTNGYFVCFLCNEKFLKYATLLWHFDTHLPDEIIKCIKCRKVFPDFHALQMHCCLNLGGDPLTCNSCHIQFKDVVTFATEHPCIIVSGVMQCPCCSYTDKSEKVFTEHFSRHVGKGIHRCDVCSRQFRTEKSLNVHQKRHWAKDEEKIPCKLCGKRFLNDRDVVRHGIAMHGVKKYKCSECPRAYARETFLKHHINREHVMKQCMFNEGVGQAASRPCSWSAKKANSMSANDDPMHERCMDEDERCVLPVEPQGLPGSQVKDSVVNSPADVVLETERHKNESRWQDEGDRCYSASSTTSVTDVTIPHSDTLSPAFSTNNTTGLHVEVKSGLVLREIENNSFQDSVPTHLVASDEVPDEPLLNTSTFKRDSKSSNDPFPYPVDQFDAILTPVIPLHDLKNLPLFKQMVASESSRVSQEQFTVLKQAISSWEEKYKLRTEVNGKHNELLEEPNTRKTSTSESGSKVNEFSRETRSMPPEKLEITDGESRDSSAIIELDLPVSISASMIPSVSHSDRRDDQRGEPSRKTFYGALPIFCHYVGDDSSSEEDEAEGGTPDRTVTISQCEETEKDPSRSLTPDSVAANDPADGKEVELDEELSASPLDAFLASVRALGGPSKGELLNEGSVKEMLPEQCPTLDDLVSLPIDGSVEGNATTAASTNGEAMDPFALQCSICKSMFSSLTLLKRHESQDHPLRCELCNKVFTSKARLENHVCLSKKKPAWICQYCAEKFPSSSLLVEHRNNHHKGHEVGCIQNSYLERENIERETPLPSEGSYEEESQFPALVFPPRTDGLAQASVSEGENHLRMDSRVFTTSLSRDTFSNSQESGQCKEQSTSDHQSQIYSTDALEEMDHVTVDGRRTVVLEEPLIPKLSLVKLMEEKRRDVLQLTVMLDTKSCIASTMDVSYLQTSDGASGLFIPLDCVRGIEMKTPDRPGFAPNDLLTIGSMALEPEPQNSTVDGEIEFILEGGPGEEDEAQGDILDRKGESNDLLTIIEEVELQM